MIVTTGDRVLDRRLENVGGKGAFLKEIEEAMLAGEVDLAVHSLKDVPTVLPAGLTLCAMLERADPRDALLSSGARLADLPQGAVVGTTSLRRQALLGALRPDLVVEQLRGNVDTRIRRLREGRFDAILLAMAGLTRLGRARGGDGGARPAHVRAGAGPGRDRARMPPRRPGRARGGRPARSRGHGSGGRRRAGLPRGARGRLQRPARGPRRDERRADRARGLRGGGGRQNGPAGRDAGRRARAVGQALAADLLARGAAPLLGH